MKSRVVTTALFAVMAAVLVAGIAYAEAGGPMHHRGHAAFMGQGFGLPLHELNLTDDQKAQVKQIFQSERGNIKPLMQQGMQSHQQMMQLITSGGNFDQVKATQIATQEAQTHIQMQVEHAKIASQIYQLLNTEQKAKLAEIMTKHQQRMQEHMQKNDQSAPEQQ